STGSPIRRSPGWSPAGPPGSALTGRAVSAWPRIPTSTRSSGCTWPSPAAEPGGRGPAPVRGSDRDDGVPARQVDGLVVEPHPALGQVTELQGAPGLHRHRRAPGLVRALAQRVGVRVPVVEVPHHGDRPAGLVHGQGERDADAAVTAGLSRLDHLTLHSVLQSATRAE